MAPEILLLEPYNDKVDIWTVGVLLYELFHNIEPFKGETPQEVLQAILTNNLKFDKNCPKEARDLIKYILNINKNYRPKISQILNHPYLKEEAQPAITTPVSAPLGGTNSHVLRLAHEHGQWQTTNQGPMIQSKSHHHQGSLQLHHNTFQNKTYNQPSSNLNGLSVGQRFSVKEYKPQEPLFGQTQSDKMIPSGGVFAQPSITSNPLRSTAYTVQAKPSAPMISQETQQKPTAGSVQIISQRAGSDKNYPNYTPLTVGHSASYRNLQKPSLNYSENITIQSTQNNPSSNQRVYSPQSPPLRSVASHSPQPQTYQAQTIIQGSQPASDHNRLLTLHHQQANNSSPNRITTIPTGQGSPILGSNSQRQVQVTQQPLYSTYSQASSKRL